MEREIKDRYCILHVIRELGVKYFIWFTTPEAHTYAMITGSVRKHVYLLIDLSRILKDTTINETRLLFQRQSLLIDLFIYEMQK